MHTESDRRHLPSVIERFVLRGRHQDNFSAGFFWTNKWADQFSGSFLSSAEATPRETLTCWGKRMMPGRFQFNKRCQKRGSKEGREVFIFSRVDTKTPRRTYRPHHSPALSLWLDIQTFRTPHLVLRSPNPLSFLQGSCLSAQHPGTCFILKMKIFILMICGCLAGGKRREISLTYAAWRHQAPD